MKNTNTHQWKRNPRNINLFMIIGILIASLLIPNKGQAQTYHKITDTTKVWNTLNVAYYGSFFIAYGSTDTHKFNDTINLGGFTWHVLDVTTDSLLINWSDDAYIREDTLEKKVYLHDADDNLLYDFSLTKGDTFHVNNYTIGLYDEILICDSTDHLEMMGVQRKRLFFRPAEIMEHTEVWIEGIGSLYGILNSGMGAVAWGGGSVELICTKKNGELIYQHDVFQDCWYDEFYPKITNEYYDTAFVGMEYEMQLQLTDTSGIDSVSWYAEEMPEGLMLDETTGRIYGSPQDTGSHLCMVKVRNKDLNLNTDILISDIVVMPFTGIDPESKLTDIEIYPNPANDHVKISGNFRENSVLTITDISGREIHSQTIRSDHFKLKTGEFEAGIYLVRISAGKQHIVRKLFIR